MNQNNGHHRLAAVDVIEDEQTTEPATSTFYDPANPELKPAQPLEGGKKKGWKRRLIGWCFVLLLIGGAAVALYLLLRVNKVDIKVQADWHRNSQSSKANGSSGNSDNTLTAEAINIARSANGADSGANNASASPSPNASPIPSITPPGNTNYSFSGNTSPVFEPFNDANSNGNSQQGNTVITQVAKAGVLSEAVQVENHANVTQSIFVGEESSRLSSSSPPTSIGSLRSSAGSKAAFSHGVRPTPAVLPPFGTMLPVRTQGVIFTLRNDSYARLELTRDAAGEGWSLPKGTVFIGRTTGNEQDRAYVNVIGYIDPRDNKLVKMAGEVMGADGAAGIAGKRLGVDRNALRNALRKVASSGVQVAGMMASALGRGPVVIDSAGYRLATPITNEARNAVTGSGSKSFVKVQAGQAAYIMVSDLPKSIQAVDAPGDDDLARAATSLTEREVMELILFGSPDEIRAALPLMTEEQKRLAARTLIPGTKDR